MKTAYTLLLLSVGILGMLSMSDSPNVCTGIFTGSILIAVGYLQNHKGFE